MAAITTMPCLLCGAEYAEHASLAASAHLYCSMTCEVEHRELNGEDVDELAAAARATIAFERETRTVRRTVHCADCGHQHPEVTDEPPATACCVCGSPRLALVATAERKAVAA